MKEIVVAKSAGFCFGVKRAVDTVYTQLTDKKEPIYTYGPIIHNEEVVKDLSQKGVIVIEDVKSLEKYPPGKIVIRSHGIAKAEYEAIKKAGYEILDATCPFVKKIHRAVEKYTEEKNHIIIIGNANHPEVLGIRGWCDPKHTTVIETAEEAKAFSLQKEQRICIVSQTTFNSIKFQELVEIITEKGYDINVLNTICNATEERQNEAAEIAGKVDAMIVIGGKSSSNTQKLYEICKKKCQHTFYVQTWHDIKPETFKSCKNVGITAGASTPKNIIEEVQTNVRNEF